MARAHDIPLLPTCKAILGHSLIAIALAVIAGCATQPDSTLVGSHRCESFLIYEVCVADLDENGNVDFIYFGDDLQVFMYHDAQERALRAVQPFHECAVTMSADTRDLSSELLYGEGLTLTQRLSIKGRLIGSYRAARPAVSACNTAAKKARGEAANEDPFDVGEDWDEGVP
ncbi:MAG: hypothetical protein AAFY29_21830 [Pseudomonadota bacterium]